MKTHYQNICFALFMLFFLCQDAQTQSILMGSETVPTGSVKDTLFFYNQDLGALRFGNIQSSQNWSLNNIGRNSFAAGKNTRASGLNSVALGDNSTASGISSFSLGQNTQSTANYSLTAGYGSIASGNASVAIGQNTKASGFTSSAFGNNSDATGNYSFTAGNGNIASGASSIAMGSAAMATKTASISIGIQTEATGTYSFATGRTTNAKAYNSFVMGRFNEGLGTEGSWDPIDPILEVGIGADADNKANALTILKNGNHGIGTSAPMTLLDVHGSTRIETASSSSNPHLELHDTNDGYGRLKFSRPSANSDNYWTLAARPSEGDAASRFNVYYSGDSLSGNILSVTGLGRLGVNLFNELASDGIHVNAKNGDHGMRVQIEGQTKLRVLNNGGTSIGSNNINGTTTNGLYVSGNTGIGVNSPTEKLEVNGAVVVGDTEGTTAGAIRYHDGDFEGFDGINWVSLTARKSEWGNGPKVTEVTERASETNSDLISIGDFGADIDISMDYAVVSSGFDNPNGIGNQGSAAIYQANGDGWNHVQQITSNDGDTQDRFGESVDISGDYLIAGSPYKNNLATDNGAAYIFKRYGNTWEQYQKILSPAGVDSYRFGSSVAIKGIHAVVVGGDGSANNLTLYIYRLQGGSWLLQQEIFGGSFLSIDISIDLSDDGEYIVCGVPYSTVNGVSNAGIALTYIRSGNTWSIQNVLTATTSSYGDKFGQSIAMDGNNLAIGCLNEDVGTVNAAGVVYTYNLTGANWVFSKKIYSPSLYGSANFGRSIDMDSGHLLISQPGNCYNTPDAIRVSYLYEKVASKWILTNEFKPSSYDESTMGFGTVAMDNNRIIIGTRRSDYLCNSQLHPLFFYSKE